MSQTNAAPPPGWYPDPWSPHGVARWWDGVQWTSHAAAAPAMPVDNGRSPQGVPLAGQGARLVARIIDGVVVSIATLVPLALLGWAMFSHAISRFIDINSDSRLTPEEQTQQTDALWSDYAPRAWALYLLLLVVMIVVPIVYEALLTSRYGQTLGKRVVGVRVVRLSDGHRLSVGASFGRAGATALLSSIYVDQLWCLWDKPWRQCLHDKVVSSVVVKA